MKQVRKYIPIYAVLIIISIIICLANRTMFSARIFAVLLVGINIATVIIVRKDLKKIIVSGFILWSNYSICVTNYCLSNGGFFSSWDNDNVVIIAMSILLVFNIFLMKILITTQNSGYSILINEKNNSFLVWITVGVLIFIFVFCFQRPEKLGMRGTPNSIYEYSVILFILAFLYSGNRYEKISLLVLACLFCIQDLAFANRVTSLQLIICCLVIYQCKVNVKLIIPIAVIVGGVLLSVGTLRAGLSLDGLYAVFEDLFKSKLTFDTAYSAFYTSLTFIKVSEITPPITKVGMLIMFILSNIIGGGRIPNSNLPEYTHDVFIHYYGGITPFYFFFYLSWIGLGLGIVYILFLFKNIFNNDKKNKFVDLKECLAIYVVATCPRWYLYSPLPLIRGILLLSIAYFIYLAADIILKKLLSILKEERHG